MMDFHPYAESFPLMTGARWELFKQSILTTGGNKEEPICYRVVGGTKQGLDGRNRLRACLELHLPIHYREVEVADEDVEEWILRRNYFRRQMTSEELGVVVNQLHKDGKSYRKIAKILGIGYGTVQRAMQGGADPNGSPRNPPPLTPQVLCRPCRVGVASPGCPDCKKLREAAKSKPMPSIAEFLDDAPQREPGDDTEVVACDEAEMKIALWKKWNNWCVWLHHLKHAPESMIEVFPGTIEGKEILAFQRRIEEEIAQLKKWKKNLIKKGS